LIIGINNLNGCGLWYINMALFEKDGNIYFVDRNMNEENELFYERANFIVCLCVRGEDYGNCVRYSNMYMNRKYLKCEYGRDVLDVLEEMEYRVHH